MNTSFLVGRFTGHLVGAAIAVVLLSWLFEWALLKRVLDDPVKGKVGSALLAWLFGSLLWGAQNSFVEGAIIYGIPTIPIAIWKYRDGRKMRDGTGEMSELEDTFS